MKTKTFDVDGATLVHLISIIEKEERRNRTVLKKTSFLKRLFTRKDDNDLHTAEEHTGGDA